MKSQNLQHFLKDADGNRVPVEQPVYDAWWHYENKDDYFMRRLKEERFRYDPEKQIAEFLPSREDSYDRLLEEGEEFASDEKPVEEAAITSVIVKDLLNDTTEEERRIIWLTFVMEATEDEASKALHLTRASYQRRRDALLKRWRKKYNDSS